MAYKNVKDLMTAICDSVREKEGSSELIPHQELPERIRGIQSGGVFIEKYEYVNCSGYGLITDIALKKNHEIHVVFDHNYYSGSDAIFGNTESNGHLYANLMMYSNKWCTGADGAEIQFGSVSGASSGVHAFVYNDDNNNIVLDGVAYGNISPKDQTASYTLGCRSKVNYYVYEAKLYYFQIIDKTTKKVVHWIVPAVIKNISPIDNSEKSQNVMFDMITGTVYDLPAYWGLGGEKNKLINLSYDISDTVYGNILSEQSEVIARTSDGSHVFTKVNSGNAMAGAFYAESADGLQKAVGIVAVASTADAASFTLDDTVYEGSYGTLSGINGKGFNFTNIAYITGLGKGDLILNNHVVFMGKTYTLPASNEPSIAYDVVSDLLEYWNNKYVSDTVSTKKYTINEWNGEEYITDNIFSS